MLRGRAPTSLQMLLVTPSNNSATVNVSAPAGMRWTPRAALPDEPVPSAMKKVLAHALDPLAQLR